MGVARPPMLFNPIQSSPGPGVFVARGVCPGGPHPFYHPCPHQYMRMHAPVLVRAWPVRVASLGLPLGPSTVAQCLGTVRMQVCILGLS